MFLKNAVIGFPLKKKFYLARFIAIFLNTAMGPIQKNAAKNTYKRGYRLVIVAFFCKHV